MLSSGNIAVVETEMRELSFAMKLIDEEIAMSCTRKKRCMVSFIAKNRFFSK